MNTVALTRSTRLLASPTFKASSHAGRQLMGETASVAAVYGSRQAVRKAGYATNSASQHSSEVENPMSWPEFLALRKKQRRYALIASGPTTLAGLSGGVSWFASKEAVPTELIMGIEPLYAYAIATIACTMGGYLAGPTLGHFIFRAGLSSSQRQAIRIKETDFYEHVKRNRADPSRQSVNNPVPDWFAEKVGSMKDYRRWLRDQAAYRRKATQHGMLVRQGEMATPKDF